MKTILKNYVTTNNETIVLMVTNLVTFILILLCCMSMTAQEQQNEIVFPPIAVKAAFERDFPNEIPLWSKNYGGEDSDQLRYNVQFKINSTEALAVYDNLGNLKAYEVLLQKKDIPIKIIDYLSKNFKGVTVSEASKVKNDKNETTYEIGIIRDEKFYDIIFDNNKDFIKIIEKD